MQKSMRNQLQLNASENTSINFFEGTTKRNANKCLIKLGKNDVRFYFKVV